MVNAMTPNNLTLRIAAVLMAACATIGMLVRATDPPPTNPALATKTIQPTAAAPEPPVKPIPKELQPFQGYWKMTICDSDNEKLGAEQQEASKWRWTIKGDEIIWGRKGEEWKLSLNVDPSKNPKEIDLTYLNGPFKGEKVLGMYEWGGIDGKCLNISIQDPGAKVARPTRFSWTGGGQTAMVSLRPTDAVDPKRELASLQGTWSFDNVMTDTAWSKPIGKIADKNGQGGERKWIMKGNEITWTRPDGKAVKASFTIGPKKVPGQIDITFLSGPNKGEKCRGIYEWAGNELWLCFLDPGRKGDRPKYMRYASNAGNTWVFLTRYLTPAEEELQLFAGVWKFDICESEWWPMNRPTTKDEFPKWRWTVKGNEMSWTGVSTGDVKVSFSVDPTKSPKEIDFTFLDGPHKGEKCLGAYKLKGGSLWVCLADPGTKGARPLEFSAGTGKGRSLLILDPVEHKK